MTYLRQVKPELVRLRERVEELQERNKALLRADELMQVSKSGVTNFLLHYRVKKSSAEL